MKEMISNHDDMDKRLAIFFGLGAFLMSAMVGLIRGYTLEGFLMQGIVVLLLAILVGYAFGTWLRHALISSTPAEELPQNTERRQRNAETLEEGSLVIPGQGDDTIVAEDPASPSGQVVNFSFPEIIPGASESSSAFGQTAPQTVVEAVAEEPEGDLAPPGVPSWLK